jgi:pimeloyl-ACP methyl ester carboxylesterase
MDYFKTCRGIPVYISDTEKGESAVVLLHGYLETSAVWSDFVGLLRPLRVVTFDLPGNGLSGTGDENTMEFIADVTADVMTHCGIESATVAGHSMGGYAALAFAEKYPERTERLCLLHSTPNPDTEEKKLNRDREIALIEAAKLGAVLNVSIPHMFATANVKRMHDAIALISANAMISDPKGIIACLRGMKNRRDMNGFLAAFDKPLLMVFGKNDNYISEEAARTLTEKFPKAQVATLENSGHAGFLEEPETVARTLVKFILNQS